MGGRGGAGGIGAGRGGHGRFCAFLAEGRGGDAQAMKGIFVRGISNYLGLEELEGAGYLHGGRGGRYVEGGVGVGVELEGKAGGVRGYGRGA